MFRGLVFGAGILKPVSGVLGLLQGIFEGACGRAGGVLETWEDSNFAS